MAPLFTKEKVPVFDSELIQKNCSVGSFKSFFGWTDELQAE